VVSLVRSARTIYTLNLTPKVRFTLNQDNFEAEVNYESSINIINTDYTYRYINFLLYSQINTYSNGFLDLKFELGIGSSSLPIQKYFELESGFSGYDRFKTFRTLDLNSFVGNKKIALFIEHNFHNSLFQLSHIPYIKDLKYDLFAIFNSGWAGNSNLSSLVSNDFYSEFGFGIGRIFNILRFEFIWQSRKVLNSTPFMFTIKLSDFEI